MTSGKKKMILKIGSSTLTRGSGQISRGKVEDIARQILHLRDEYDIVLVSSGAIATARQFIQLGDGPTMAVKQALAAVGQPALMRIYQEVFSDFGLRVAQCLLTYRDFENVKSRSNTNNTLQALHQHGYIPIINENDTVSTEEIQFGDNDKLAALTASLVEADLLILASDINGLYDKDPKQNPDAVLVTHVNSIGKIMHMAGDSKSRQGTGGMQSKLEAAAICEKNGVDMWIVNGWVENFAVDALEGKIECTRFQFGE